MLRNGQETLDGLRRDLAQKQESLRLAEGVVRYAQEHNAPNDHVNDWVEVVINFKLDIELLEAQVAELERLVLPH